VAQLLVVGAGAHEEPVSASAEGEVVAPVAAVVALAAVAVVLAAVVVALAAVVAALAVGAGNALGAPAPRLAEAA
jgi:hypothetical protein